jgi:hypothetical protein
MRAASGTWWVIPLVGLALLAPAAAGQAAIPDAGPASAAAEAEATPLESLALETLRRMGVLLRSSRTLSFTASGFREELGTTGQTVAFFRTVRVQLQRPNQVRIDVRGELTNLSLWYDGRTVTLLDPVKKGFGSTQAPPTIDQTITFLSKRFGTVFTISALLVADPFATLSDGLQTGFVVGEAEVGGVRCDHLAFSEKDVDWQVWVQRGPTPLPRRVAVTFKTRPGAQREVLDLSDWRLGTSIPARTFAFTAPPGSFHAEMIPQPPEEEGTP